MFGQTVTNEWMFEGSAQTEALSRVMYVAEQRLPFVLLQGPRGSGKSTLLSRVQTECVQDAFSVVRMNVASLDQSAFFVHLAGALSIVPDKSRSLIQLMTAIRDEINGRAVCDHRVVVLLDDLHLMTEEAASVIQFLCGINQQTNGCLTIVASAEETISQDVSVLSELRVILKKLSDSEATSFVLGHLSASNQTAQLTHDTVTAIVQFGAGMPGRLTRACEMISIASATDDSLQIDEKLFGELARETLLADVA